MATLASNVVTLADHAKSYGPKGKLLKTVEILSQTNEMLEDAHYVEGNLPTGHQVEVRTGLPASYWRLMNKGTPSSKATSAQVTENCGTLVGRSQVDRDIAELNGNVKEYRFKQAKPHMESMNQEMAGTEIYGAASSPEEFVGFNNRYTSTSDANGENIILGGGSGADNTSIILVGWGDNSIYNIFPKGSKAGLSHEDLGLQDAFDSSNNRYRAYMDEFNWKTGLVVADWRYGVRIPNIDISDLKTLANTQAVTAATAIHKLMAQAIDRLPSMNDVKPCFYVNRTVKSHLRVMAMAATTSVLSIEEGLNQFGKTIHEVKFLGIPVRTMDAITNAEDLVS